MSDEATYRAVPLFSEGQLKILFGGRNLSFWSSLTPCSISLSTLLSAIYILLPKVFSYCNPLN